MDTRLQRLFLSLILLISILTLSFAFRGKGCTPDGLTVCFDAKKNAFKIEDAAQLKILVPNSEYGQAVVDYWDWYHPDHKGKVTYELINESAGSQDVFFITQVQAGRLYEQLYPLSPVLTKNVDLKKVAALNLDHLTYVPLTAEGFSFLINKTRLELLGLSLEDKNKDGLIDTVDTFEKIIELKALWDSLQVEVLPIALNEPYSFYPYLTAGDFRIFKEYDALRPGFDGPEFKQSLQLIQDLSQINWNHSETNASETYTWKLDEVLVEDNFVFTVVGSWMDLNESDAAVQSEWIASKFPSYQGNELSPMVRTSGLAINVNTLYPSAAHELIRILKSIKGLQLLIDTTDKIPLVNETTFPYLTFNDLHRSELAFAYQYSVGEPIIAFAGNPENLAIELYYHMDLMSIIRDLWDQKISIDEAQSLIVAEATRVIEVLNKNEDLSDE